eukprot:SAG25_NODE_4662_length_773_cov_0.888724_1_plen_154_part_10
MSARASSLASVAAEDMDAVMGKLRGREFARLDGAVYLDHAGATLHSELQLAEALAQLNCQLLGNPHSQNDSSVRAGEGVDRAREAAAMTPPRTAPSSRNHTAAATTPLTPRVHVSGSGVIYSKMATSKERANKRGLGFRKSDPVRMHSEYGKVW